MSQSDTEAKNILESERVCSRHFVSGKPAATWYKRNIDWVPTLNLSKKDYKENEQKNNNRGLQKKGLKEQKNAESA